MISLRSPLLQSNFPQVAVAGFLSEPYPTCQSRSDLLVNGRYFTIHNSQFKTAVTIPPPYVYHSSQVSKFLPVPPLAALVGVLAEPHPACQSRPDLLVNGRYFTIHNFSFTIHNSKRQPHPACQSRPDLSANGRYPSNNEF